MVLITDGGPDGSLTPFISTGGGGGMGSFVPTEPPTITAHPPYGPSDRNPGHAAKKGDWQLQMDFIPDKAGNVVGVSYSQYTGAEVPCPAHGEHGCAGKQDCGQQGCGTYTHTVYKLLQPLLAGARG